MTNEHDLRICPKIDVDFDERFNHMLTHMIKLAKFSATHFDNNQNDILVGEMAELTCELMDDKRNRSSIEKITEELSHVMVSSIVLMLTRNISPEAITEECMIKLKKYNVT